VDLGFRLRLLGHSVVQSPDAVVAHVGGGSAGTRSPFAEFHGARNRVWTFLKCMPGPLLWLMLPAHLLASIILCAVGPLRGRGYHALRGFFAALADLGPAFAERCRIQGARRARTLDIARSLAWSPDVLLTRRPVLRRIRGTCSTAPGAWAERSAPCPRPPRDRLAR
jgi:GT2 family glycosyltransferase